MISLRVARAARSYARMMTNTRDDGGNDGGGSRSGGGGSGVDKGAILDHYAQKIVPRTMSTPAIDSVHPHLMLFSLISRIISVPVLVRRLLPMTCDENETPILPRAVLHSANKVLHFRTCSVSLSLSFLYRYTHVNSS